jgi:hypothetical protein
MIRPLPLCLLASCLVAADHIPPAHQVPVATVGERTLTLRDLEDELLRREGVDLLLRIVEARLRNLDLSRLPPDGELLRIGGVSIGRETLATELLRSSSDTVLGDLIGIAVVEQALIREGIIITDAVLDDEVERYRTRLMDLTKRKGMPQVPLEDYLRQEQNLDIDGLRRQAGFRMEAGLHTLVLRGSPVSDEQITAWFQRFGHELGHGEQVDLELIHLPYPPVEGSATSPSDEQREGTRALAVNYYSQLAKGAVSFADLWVRAVGPRLDPHAREGRIGWVGRDGRRAQAGTLVLSQRTMAAAFQADLTRGRPPLVLVEHEGGMDIVRVRGRRPPSQPGLDDSRSEVRRRIIEAELEPRSKAMMIELRQRSEVRHHSFGAVVQRRLEQQLGSATTAR